MRRAARLGSSRALRRRRPDDSDTAPSATNVGRLAQLHIDLLLPAKRDTYRRLKTSRTPLRGRRCTRRRRAPATTARGATAGSAARAAAAPPARNNRASSRQTRALASFPPIRTSSGGSGARRSQQSSSSNRARTPSASFSTAPETHQGSE